MLRYNENVLKLRQLFPRNLELFIRKNLPCNMEVSNTTKKNVSSF